MITEVELSNVGKREYKRLIPHKLIVNSDSTIEEWDSVPDLISTLKNLKDLITLFTNSGRYGEFWFKESDETKESTVDIKMDWEGKHYKYSVVFYQGNLIMESLLEGNSFVFSRFFDSPDFALSESYFTEEELYRYNIFKEYFTGPLLEFCGPGKELIREVKNIIFIDEWLSKTDTGFLTDFRELFPDLDYKKLVDTVISEFGFDSDYEETIIENSRSLVSKKLKSVTIPFESAGSGFTLLATVFPLMVAAKKYNYILVSEIPLDASLHCILSKNLMSWFLEEGPDVNVIARLQHTKV